MNRLIRVWLCVVFVLGTTQGCGPKDGTDPLNNQSLRAANRDASLAASVDAEDADDPSIEPRTHFAAGRLLEGKQQFDKAIEQYRIAIKKDPKFVEVHNRLGVIYGLLNLSTEAEASLNTAIELKPDSPHLVNNLGFEFLRQKRFRRAEKEFRRALDMSPAFLKARGNLAVSLAAQKRFDDALTEFRMMLPEPDAVYNLGLALKAHGRYGEARAAFERVLAINQNFEAASKQLTDIPADMPGEKKTGLDAETELKLVQSLAPTLDSGEVVNDDWAQVILSMARELDELKETMRQKDLQMAQHAALVGQQQAVMRSQQGVDVEPSTIGEVDQPVNAESAIVIRSIDNTEEDIDVIDEAVIEETKLLPVIMEEVKEEPAPLIEKSPAPIQAIEEVVVEEPMIIGHSEEVIPEAEPMNELPVLALADTREKPYEVKTVQLAAAFASPPKEPQQKVESPVLIPNQEPCFDFDRDTEVNLLDYAGFQTCFNEQSGALSERCKAGDMDEDGDVDLADFRELYRLLDTSGCPF